MSGRRVAAAKLGGMGRPDRTELGGGDVASLFDHTLLAPEAAAADIDRLCDEATEAAVFAVCVNERWVERVARRLDTTSIATCAVVDFPLGAGSTAAAVGGARSAVAHGAVEIDVVIPLGPLLAGDDEAVATHLAAVRDATDRSLLKVIVESGALDDITLRRACRLVEDSGADFVKTSTGFHPTGGATVEAVATMRDVVGDRLGIKASGGIRTADAVRAMVAAGATRIGASVTVAILAELSTPDDPLDRPDPAGPTER